MEYVYLKKKTKQNPKESSDYMECIAFDLLPIFH